MADEPADGLPGTEAPRSEPARRTYIRHDRQDALERYTFMMGEARGRLAVTLDILTDALVLVGQHGVYCTSARDARVPAKDLGIAREQIEGAKDLIQEVMERLRRERLDRV